MLVFSQNSQIQILILKPRQCVKSRDITLPAKFSIVKTMVFPVVIYSCDSWTIKKADHQRIDLLNCCAGEDS